MYIHIYERNYHIAASVIKGVSCALINDGVDLINVMRLQRERVTPSLELLERAELPFVFMRLH